MLTVKRSAMCSTRGGSQGMYIMFASAMQIRQPTLALKTRGDITRNPKQEYQWPPKRTIVRQKYKNRSVTYLKKCQNSKTTCFPTFDVFHNPRFLERSGDTSQGVGARSGVGHMTSASQPRFLKIMAQEAGIKEASRGQRRMRGGGGSRKRG